MIGDGERDTRRLRILLIAYEFPPSPSPQSLRWAYLANRLVAAGHDVHVLAPDIGDGPLCDALSYYSIKLTPVLR